VSFIARDFPYLYLQPLNNAAMHQMFLNDFFNVFLVDVCVPNGFGVDHEYRAVVAAVHATGLVDANLAFALEFQFTDTILGIGLHLGGAEAVATGFAFSALVAAEKNVMLEMAHAEISLVECCVSVLNFTLIAHDFRLAAD
jgi:hypothetical protein